METVTLRKAATAKIKAAKGGTTLLPTLAYKTKSMSAKIPTINATHPIEETTIKDFNQPRSSVRYGADIVAEVDTNKRLDRAILFGPQLNSLTAFRSRICNKALSH